MEAWTTQGRSRKHGLFFQQNFWECECKRTLYQEAPSSDIFEKLFFTFAVWKRWTQHKRASWLVLSVLFSNFWLLSPLPRIQHVCLTVQYFKENKDNKKRRNVTVSGNLRHLEGDCFVRNTGRKVKGTQNSS